MEEQRKKVNEEYEAINKELQHCKDEYDAYERKDIQYHENMKAQKANLKRLRGKCKTNEEEKETKEKSVVTMEANLTRLERDVVVVMEKKEKLEEELSQVLTKYKEEINRLKERRTEIEVWDGW